MLIADNNREYIKFEVEYGTWYTFYPYNKETELFEYIYSQLLVTYIIDEGDVETYEEDSLRESVILLQNFRYINHFSEIEITPQGGGTFIYKIDAQYVDVWEQNWNVTFYTDGKGNPILMQDWEEELQR